MTAKSRKAIVQYWLWKHWMGTSLFVFLILFSSQAFAEVKAIQTKPLEQKSALKVPASAPAKSASAKDEKKKDEKIVEKVGTGNLVFIKKTKAAVEFKSGKDVPLEEMYLPFSKDFKFTNVKDYSELGYGDTVKVKYQETVKPGAKPSDPPQVGNRMAVEITLVKSVQPPKPPKVQGEALLAKEVLRV